MYLIKSIKSPFYQVIFTRNGKRTTISTKTSFKSEALKFLNEFEKKLLKEEIKPQIDLQTFGDEYSDLIHTTKSKKYSLGVRLSFKKLREFTGNLPLNKIDFRLVEKFVSLTFQRSESGAAFYYRTLKAAFSKAETWEYIERNPFLKVKLPKLKTNLPSYLTESEFNFLLGFIREPLLKDFYTVLFYTGLRAGELCNLQLTNIDLSQRLMKISNTETFSTKSKKERLIPMNEAVFQIFKNRLPQVHRLNRKLYIFYRIAQDIPLTVDYVSKKFKSSIRKAGMSENLHLHSLRHSFCSNLVNANVSLYIVQQLAGHSSTKTTEIYSHTNTGSLQTAVNLLGNNNLSINKIG
ncbi:MAG: tyrosine-type recombinase/integrase [Ignavibacteriaceae bacterium]|nr:tyrosine-type recombinase/integrase [Ignavibacteriaceae bacterium]